MPIISGAPMAIWLAARLTDGIMPWSSAEMMPSITRCTARTCSRGAGQPSLHVEKAAQGLEAAERDRKGQGLGQVVVRPDLQPWTMSPSPAQRGPG